MDAILKEYTVNVPADELSVNITENAQFTLCLIEVPDKIWAFYDENGGKRRGCQVPIMDLFAAIKKLVDENMGK